ncbi:hypothetical protein NESM_000095300 [Novymonas esmeraldas]|uniref:Uncharacterized protein n=1 Tax=Novymonas esmeraldas TaxID=1808958 RepID=A0AAW0F1E4_9TRYP
MEGPSPSPPPPHAFFNGSEMRRQVHQYHQRQWRCRVAARLLIRAAIWLLGAWTMSGWHPRAVHVYLVASAAILAWVVLLPCASHTAEAAGRSSRGDSVGRVRRAARATHSVSVAEPAAVSCPTYAPHASLPSHAAAEASPGDATFTGALTPAQQRALLVALKDCRTAGATRCAMDKGFRQRLMESELGEWAVCLCGSGEAFGCCCAPVKAELLRVLLCAV